MNSSVGSINGYIAFLKEKLKSSKGKEKKALKRELDRYMKIFCGE